MCFSTISQRGRFRFRFLENGSGGSGSAFGSCESGSDGSGFRFRFGFGATLDYFPRFRGFPWCQGLRSGPLRSKNAAFCVCVVRSTTLHDPPLQSLLFHLLFFCDFPSFFCVFSRLFQGFKDSAERKILAFFRAAKKPRIGGSG